MIPVYTLEIASIGSLAFSSFLPFSIFCQKFLQPFTYLHAIWTVGEWSIDDVMMMMRIILMIMMTMTIVVSADACQNCGICTFIAPPRTEWDLKCGFTQTRPHQAHLYFTPFHQNNIQGPDLLVEISSSYENRRECTRTLRNAEYAKIWQEPFDNAMDLGKVEYNVGKYMVNCIGWYVDSTLLRKLAVNIFHIFFSDLLLKYEWWSKFREQKTK